MKREEHNLAKSLLLFLLPAAFCLVLAAAVPRAAADLTYKLPGGQVQNLKQYRGKVVALEFILTTCPHCQDASKVMSRMQKELGPRGFQAIDIAVNDGAARLVSGFVKEFGVAFPVGYTDDRTALAFLDLAPQRVLFPQMVLIDREGMIRYQSEITGDALVVDESALRTKIESLLIRDRASGKSATH
jgi:thiol-disulfide isomerase/thioredoxin